MDKKGIFISCLLILFCTFLAKAQNQKTLQECINIAWEKNISIKQTNLGLLNSDIDLRQAKAGRYPNLNGGSSFNISGRSVDPTNNQFASSSFLSNNYNLNSNMILYNGGVVKNNIIKANLSKQSAEFQALDIKQTIALEVSRAYLNVLFTEENLSLAEKRMEITSKQLAQLDILISAGLRPKNKRYEMEATLAANEQSMIGAQGNNDIARLQLIQIMRFSADERFDLVVPEVLLAELDNPFTLDVAVIFNTAAGKQPALKNSALKIKMAEVDQSIASAGLLPSIGVGGSVGTNYSSLAKQLIDTETIIQDQTIYINNIETTVGFPVTIPNLENQPYISQISDNITYGYGLNISIPIYNNNRNKANISRAKIGTESAILTDQRNRDQFRQQIEQALIDAKNSKKQYDAAEKSVIARRKALDNLQAGFEIGSTNSFELTIATTQYDNALTQRLIAKYDFIFKMKIIDFYLGKPIQF